MTKIKNGDILEIPLKADLGYGYAKYIDSIKYYPKKNIPSILRVFNFYSSSSISNISLVNKELLIAPLSIIGIKGINKLGWKIIGNENVTIEELFLPDVKTEYLFSNEESEKWGYYENLGDTTKFHFSTKDKINHLDWVGDINSVHVPFRISYEILKANGKDIKRIIELNEFEKMQYEQRKDMPLYTKLKPSIQGRVIK